MIILFYTPEEIAELLKIPVEYVLDSLQQKKMEGIKVGDLWRITPSQFDKFIKSNSSSRTSNRYSKLEQYLNGVNSKEISLDMKFDELETILEYKLPKSAFVYRAWWANDSTHSQGIAWMNAKWKVESVNFKSKVVRFVREV